MELYLAKLLGLYLVIMGIVMLTRRRALIPAIGELMGNRAILFVVAIIEVAAGIALVLAYPRVESSLTGALSLLGYLMAIEAMIYLTASQRFIRWFVRLVNRPSLYVVYGVIAVILGVLLAASGFGISLLPL